MTKETLLKSFCAVLREEIAVMTKAVADSVENATGDETRSEGKYDTRATEAAYLAEAQREQSRLKEQSLAQLEALVFPDFSSTEGVEAYALVEIEALDGEDKGETAFYFLLPTAGGLMTTHLGCPATVITPESPLYQSLLGMKAGQKIDRPRLIVQGVE